MNNRKNEHSIFFYFKSKSSFCYRKFCSKISESVKQNTVCQNNDAAVILNKRLQRNHFQGFSFVFKKTNIHFYNKGEWGEVKPEQDDMT